MFKRIKNFLKNRRIKKLYNRCYEIMLRINKATEGYCSGSWRPEIKEVCCSKICPYFIDLD